MKGNYFSETNVKTLDKIVRSCLPKELHYEEVEVSENSEYIRLEYYFPMKELSNSEYTENYIETEIAKRIEEKVEKHSKEIIFDNCWLEGIEEGELEAFRKGDETVYDPCIVVEFFNKYL